MSNKTSIIFFDTLPLTKMSVYLRSILRGWRFVFLVPSKEKLKPLDPSGHGHFIALGLKDSIRWNIHKISYLARFMMISLLKAKSSVLCPS